MHSNVFTMRIVRSLTKCEQGADQLLADTAGLVSELVGARLATDAAFGTGQRALNRVVEAQKSLLSAQADLMRAHADLLKIGQERGDIMTGDCPPGQFLLSDAA